MTRDDIKTTIAPVAPALAVMLDGAMSDVAMSALGVSLAGDAAATLDMIGSALNGNGTGNGADPAWKDKVKEAETSAFNHLTAATGDPGQAQREAQSAVRRLDDQDAEDRERARRHQAQAKDWWINPALATFVTIGFFAVIGYILRYPPSSNDNNSVATALLGVLGTSWVAIISFYFGSSAGSKQKTALLAERTSAKQ
jgi:hypothetical protein